MENYTPRLGEFCQVRINGEWKDTKIISKRYLNAIEFKADWVAPGAFLALPNAEFRKLPLFRQVIQTGSTYLSEENSTPVSGITIGNHHNQVECYGETLEDAIQLRDFILSLLKEKQNECS